jgi:hypothetical protein
MAYPSAPSEQVRHLELNGARISFRTQTLDAKLADVLDHYETLCDAGDAQLSEQLTRLLRQHPRAPKNLGNVHGIATLVNRDDDSGYVACLDLGTEPRGIDALVSGLARFAATGELGEVGEFRQAFARRATNASGERTFLMTMWAESELNFYKILPHGEIDAAGRDPVGVPRPPGSQRVLSAWESAQPSGVAVYRVPTWTNEALVAFYRRELDRTGWTIIETNPARSIAIDQVFLLCAEKDDRLITVLVSADAALSPLLTILSSEPV